MQKITQVNPLFHIEGTLNPVDMATRGLATAVDVEFGSDWQVGAKWMSKPKEYWLISREFRRNIPEGARRLQVFTALTRNELTLTSGGEVADSSRLERILYYSNSIEKVTGILARVLMMARTHIVIKPKSPESLTCSVSVSDWA